MDVKSVVEKAQAFFGPDAIEPDSDYASFVADPYNTLILKREHQIVGFADLIFFDRRIFDDYFSGELDFSEAFSSGALAHPYARRATVAFIPTIWHFRHRVDKSLRPAVETGILIWGLSKLIATCQQFTGSGIDFYSTAWSTEGSRLLSRLRFKRIRGSGLGPGALPNVEQVFSRPHMSRNDWEAIGKPYERLAQRFCRFELRLSAKPELP
jgi:hypothetical protein